MIAPRDSDLWTRHPDGNFDVLDHGFVRLEAVEGTELTVVNAARVSYGKRSDELSDADRGLLAYLVRNRHGCFDSATDVLTADGWKAWPDVDGSERFATLNLATNAIEYQFASRVVRRRHDGPMVRVSMMQVDALVTPDHRVVSQRFQRFPDGWKFSEPRLAPALELGEAAHRLLMGGGSWVGSIHDPIRAAIVGFIAADAHVSDTSIEFHLRREDKIAWLREHADLTPGSGKNGTYRLARDEQTMLWAKQTYGEDGERCLPRELLRDGDLETLRALFEGYMRGDGSVKVSGRMTASTVSRQMVDDLQELALKIGLVAVETSPDETRRGAYGVKPVFKVSFYGVDNRTKTRPRVGWTTEARKKQVTTEHYVGDVHCVSVPNGTLYVRRNGKPMWSGNSPAEMAGFLINVRLPIFVMREHVRHRIASINEISGRYVELPELWYVPRIQDVRCRVGKPGHYTYEPAPHDVAVQFCLEKERSGREAFARYQRWLAQGIAPEMARIDLPLNTYTEIWWRINLRSLMNYCSLRYAPTAQWEIQQYAACFEALFEEHFPTIHAAFVEGGRVAP